MSEGVDMNSPTENEGEQQITDALAPFGWTCGDEFWKRYYSDAWVFNLANAVVALSARVAVVRPTRDSAIATLLETEVWPLEWSYEDCRTAAERFSDALIREGGVAVSGSQETPAKGREE